MVSTHIMHVVDAISDRGIIINNGKIIADDTIGSNYTYTQDKINTVIL